MRIPVGKAVRLVAVAFWASLILLSTACGGAVNGETTITVYAAASLTDAFREIASEFESGNPGVSVKLNFAGSQRLRFQLQQGATADVFASADEEQMQLAYGAGLIADGIQYFAGTTMSVIVSKQSGIGSLSELGEPGARVVLAHDGVPAGVYSRQLLKLLSTSDTGLGDDYAQRVLGNVVSEEASVKVVEQKVVLGEADAGIVYRPGALTALSSGSVLELPLPPDAEELRALYPIAALNDSASRELADEFISFVLSDDGQGILASYGFDAP